MADPPAYRRIETFNPDCESIEAYLERIDLYFDANNVTNNWKMVIYAPPKSPGSRKAQREDIGWVMDHSHWLSYGPLSLAELRTTLIGWVTDHSLHPLWTETCRCGRTISFLQTEPGCRGIYGFVAELRKLSTHCQFAAGDQLSQALRDRLVCSQQERET